jgi:hypothetical protein
MSIGKTGDQVVSATLPALLQLRRDQRREHAGVILVHRDV